MAKILITGVSGFLGSSIAADLANIHCLLGTRRLTSDLYRCKSFSTEIEWLDLDDSQWKLKAVKFAPEIIIHTAWMGVESKDRDNDSVQLQNIEILEDILQVAFNAETKKIIGFGSQAEYGNISGVVDENFPLNPQSAYGKVKVRCSHLLRDFCVGEGIEWYWLRLFSLFGERQSANWLIPYAIKNILNGIEMDLTLGQQKYAYFYAGDLGKVVDRIIRSSGTSDVYNISGKGAISVKEVMEFIKENLKTDYKLKFGALPYRQDQAMHMEGDFSRFLRKVGQVTITPFYEALDRTISFYKTN